MTDYYTPTVVTPFIPEIDIIPLERLILDHVFDAEPAGEGLVYFSAEIGPCEVFSIEVAKLQCAHVESMDSASILYDHVGTLLAEYDEKTAHDPGHVDIDLTTPAIYWDRVLQDIVRRSATLDEIVVMAAWTCSKMRPDGFGGSVMRVTADRIQFCSTQCMLEEFTR